MADAEHLKRGVAAENLACVFLERKGLTVLARNYRCRSGELDLVLEDRGTVVVAEVRYRRNSRFGTPGATVDARKRAKIIRATRHFLQTRPALKNLPVRFDVVAVTGMPGRNRIDWITHAFSVRQRTT